MSCEVTSCLGSGLCQGAPPCGAVLCILGCLAEAGNTTCPGIPVGFLEGILLVPCLCPAMEEGGPAQVSGGFNVN